VSVLREPGDPVQLVERAFRQQPDNSIRIETVRGHCGGADKPSTWRLTPNESSWKGRPNATNIEGLAEAADWVGGIDRGILALLSRCKSLIR